MIKTALSQLDATPGALLSIRAKIISKATGEGADLLYRAISVEFGWGIPHITELLRDTTDRNPISSFTFTGNRFEFRVVGSPDNSDDAMITLNTAVTFQLKEFKVDVDKLIVERLTKESAIFTILKRYIVDCHPVHFEGNGYSDAWETLAVRRGLDCETSVPVIFDRLSDPESVELFTRMGVLNPGGQAGVAGG